MTDLGLPRNVRFLEGSRLEGSASIIPILHTNRNITNSKKVTQQPPYKNAAVRLIDTSASSVPLTVRIKK